MLELRKSKANTRSPISDSHYSLVSTARPFHYANCFPLTWSVPVLVLQKPDIYLEHRMILCGTCTLAGAREREIWYYQDHQL